MSLEEIRGTSSGRGSGKENVRASQDLTWKKEKRLTLEKTHPIKKWAENLTFFSRDDKQMASRYMKRCPMSLLIRELQITTTISYYRTPVRMAVTKKN